MGVSLPLYQGDFWAREDVSSEPGVDLFTARFSIMGSRGDHMNQRVWFAGLIVAGLALGADESVTFSKDVLPVLQRNCQNCHRPGNIAPMSFLTYESTRPWAKAMKAAVGSRKMPP